MTTSSELVIDSKSQLLDDWFAFSDGGEDLTGTWKESLGLQQERHSVDPGKTSVCIA